MININHLLKVTSAWVSIVYVVCFVGVALFPSLRPDFFKYGLHAVVDVGNNVFSLTTLISGLIIWNVITLLAVWLFAALYNRIK